MEIKIEVLSTIEAEIATRAVLEIAELREAAMAEYVATTQTDALLRTSAAAFVADAIEETADVIEAASTAQTPAPVAKPLTASDAIAALQAATAKGVTLPMAVEFLAKHSVKKVTDLPAEVIPAFIEYINGCIPVRSNG